MSKKVYAVHFRTESSDEYMAVFNENPTDGHLSAYVKENYPEEVIQDEEDGSFHRYIFWNVEELDIEDLPKPIDPIESI